jgi:hypothetical protein
VTAIVPVMLVALALGTDPVNAPASGRFATASPLHGALAQPGAWRLPEPGARGGRVAAPSRVTARVAPRRVARHGAAMKLGAGFVGALLGLYVGATVGGAIDCDGECYTGAIVGASVGTVACAVVGVLLVR